MIERFKRKHHNGFEWETPIGELLIRLGNITDLAGNAGEKPRYASWTALGKAACTLKATHADDIEAMVMNNKPSKEFTRYTITVTHPGAEPLEYMVDSNSINIAVTDSDKEPYFKKGLNAARTIRLLEFVRAFDEDKALANRFETWGSDGYGEPITVSKMRQRFNDIVVNDEGLHRSMKINIGLVDRILGKTPDYCPEKIHEVTGMDPFDTRDFLTRG